MRGKLNMISAAVTWSPQRYGDFSRYDSSIPRLRAVLGCTTAEIILFATAEVMGRMKKGIFGPFMTGFLVSIGRTNGCLDGSVITPTVEDQVEQQIREEAPLDEVEQILEP